MSQPELDLVTRAAVEVAAQTLRRMADELDRLDTADACRTAGELRAVVRTLMTAGAKPERKGGGK